MELAHIYSAHPEASRCLPTAGPASGRAKRKTDQLCLFEQSSGMAMFTEDDIRTCLISVANRRNEMTMPVVLADFPESRNRPYVLRLPRLVGALGGDGALWNRVLQRTARISQNATGK